MQFKVNIKKRKLSLFERSSLGETNTFYGASISISVQMLLHFEICDFVRISYKKYGKFQLLRYFI